MKCIDLYKTTIKLINDYAKNNENITFLDVGVAKKTQPYILECVIKNNIKYNILEIDTNVQGPGVIHADLCDCSEIPDETFDIIYSHNVFEHITTPWLAAEQCVRITKKGGLNIHIMPFTYDYHECPVDCFRYTPTGAKSMFEYSGQMIEVASGFNTGKVICQQEQKVSRWLMGYMGRKI